MKVNIKCQHTTGGLAQWRVIVCMKKMCNFAAQVARPSLSLARLRQAAVGRYLQAADSVVDNERRI